MPLGYVTIEVAPRNFAMDHVIIMKMSWGMLPKILAGKKTIESRWYKNKSSPWGKINPGDIIYLKNSGEEVSARVRVRKVLSFENLNSVKVRKILDKYGKQDGIENGEKEKYFNLFKSKRYCLLVFLDQPELIPPFEINKNGFGSMSAWMCVKDINRVKRRSYAPMSGI